MTTRRIAIAEPSLMIRIGLEHMLRKLSGYRFLIDDISEVDSIESHLKYYQPELLIVNPQITGINFQLPDEYRSTMLVFLLTEQICHSLLKKADGILTVGVGQEALQKLIDELFLKEVEVESEEQNEQQALSNREKEIVVGVVKGLTNKEIAKSLFLSPHTVITHRRNIAKKLQIHSPSGLTIYAIVNKLVDLSEISK